MVKKPTIVIICKVNQAVIRFGLMLPKINAKIVEILSKIMGLFLTAIAIQMMATGLTGLLAIKAATGV